VVNYCFRSHCVHLVIQKKNKPVKRDNRKWKKRFETNYG